MLVLNFLLGLSVLLLAVAGAVSAARMAGAETLDVLAFLAGCAGPSLASAVLMRLADLGAAARRAVSCAGVAAYAVALLYMPSVALRETLFFAGINGVALLVLLGVWAMIGALMAALHTFAVGVDLWKAWQEHRARRRWVGV